MKSVRVALAGLVAMTGAVVITGAGTTVAPAAVAAAASCGATPSSGHLQSTIATGLHTPRGIDVDAAGIVYVSGSGNGGEVAKLTPSGSTHDLELTGGTFVPHGLAVEAGGTVHVADRPQGTVEKLTPSGPGYVQGEVATGLTQPRAVEVDASGTVFVGDTANQRIVKLTPNGGAYAPSAVQSAPLGEVRGITTLGNTLWFTMGDTVRALNIPGNTVGSPLAVNGLVSPGGLDVDVSADPPSLVIADTGNDRIVRVSLDGPALSVVAADGLDQPEDVAVTEDGSIYVADTGNDRAVRLTPLSLSADADTASTTAGNAVTTDVVDNDTADGTTLADPTIAEDPAHGSATVNDDGTITYTPDAGFSGADSYQYALTDSSGTVCDTARVTVTVTQGNSCDPLGTTGGTTPIPIETGTDYPSNFDVDAEGNLFVTDAETNEVVRLTPTASGHARSVVATGLATPTSITVGEGGVLYVVQYGASSIVRLTPSGSGYETTTVASGGSLDRVAGIDVDAAGDLYVSTSPPGLDTGTVVRLDASAGYSQEVIATGLMFPHQVDVDDSGNVFVAAYESVVRVADTGAGWAQADVVTGLGSGNGVAVDSTGTLWFSTTEDPGLWTATPSGSGYAPKERYAPWGENHAYTLAFGPDEALVLSDFDQLVRFGPATLDAVDDTATTTSSRTVTTDVRANDASNVDLAAPSVVGAPAHGTASANPDGTIDYTPEAGWSGTDSYTYEIRDGATPATVCGLATVTVTVASAEGCPTLPSTADAFRVEGTHDLAEPTGIAVDADKVIYISDVGQERVIGWGPGSGPAGIDSADGLDPQGIAVDGERNVFYADESEHEIVKMTWTGSDYTRSVLASGLQRPSGVAVDPDGNVYFAENSSGHVHRLTPSGDTYTSSLVAAGLDRPRGLALDGDDNLYVADSTNDRIVKLTPDGSGHTMSVISTSVDSPTGVAVDSSGVVVVGDTGNDRVLRLTPSGSGYTQTEIAIWGDHTPTWVAVAEGTVLVVDSDTGEVVIIGGFGVDAVGDDAGSTAVATPVTTDVRTNDTTSPEGLPLGTPTVLDAPDGGTATVNDDGTITYLPEAGFSGADAYTYAVSDDQDPATVCDSARVTVTVTNQFTPGDGATTPQNQPVTLGLADLATTTGKGLSPTGVTSVSNPDHGTIAILSDGSVVYSPTAGHSGEDSFGVRVCDTSEPVQCADVTVPVTVGVNDVTTSDATETTPVGTPVTTDVLATTTSGTGQALSAPTVGTAPGHGTASVGDDGITYTPDAGFSGEDSYGFEVCDTSTPTPVCDASSVTVTVQNGFVAGAPLGTTWNTPVTAPLEAIVTTTGRPLAPGVTSLVRAPGHGGVAIDGETGAVTYTPDTGFSGEDAFALRVCDTSEPVQCHEAEVAVTVAAKAEPTTSPRIVTKASSRVVLKVSRAGQPATVRLSDQVTISGFVPGGASTGRATLYGPVPKAGSGTCTPARAVRTVTFTPRNGTFRTPSVPVNRPGRYTWVVATSADENNLAATHACGLAAETTLVHRPAVGNLAVEAGYSGTTARGLRAQPARLSVPAIGLSAPLSTVGARRGTMLIPSSMTRGGWYAGSAAPGEAIGSTLIAGHVSDRRDRPGVFGKLRRARVGQVVTVRAVDGTVQRYRITSVRSQARSRGISGASVSTTGAHRLTLVTCTGKVTYRNGRFHYTRNLVVTAVPIP